MPHGGYHGTVISGGKVIQQGGTGPSAGRPPRETRKSNQTATELTKQIRDQMAADPDARSAYIGAQADASRLSNLLRQEQEKNLANQVAASFAKGNVRKSDFTGDAGDKSFFGLNFGSTPTAAATVINPITGEKIITRKVREGMTSPEYATYMQGLYSLNPTLMEETFPFASGATVRNLSRFAPGLGTLQSIAGFVGGKTGDAIEGLKQIAINKGILPSTTLNPNTGTTIDPTKVQNVAELDPSTKALIAPDVYGGRSPIDEAFASLPSTQFGREYMERFGPRQGFTAFNVGGLASINNPEYTMLRRASDFDI
tara:strand:- start:64 stop:1002 length:939 start_codon:yes stop_codon:yes gene_type:complete